MQVHVLQHVEFEGLGAIAAWVEARGAALGWTRFQRGESLPEPNAADLVVALGGPMSVNDEAGHPWLRDEKVFLAARMAAGRAMLGICLGAQAMAAALGAAVRPNALREIGWFDIHAAAPDPDGAAACGAHEAGGSDGADAFVFPGSLRAFHWHGETFDLPGGATRLASSAACRNQAFQYGRRAIGLQFHLETTPASAAVLVEHAADDLAAGGPCVQGADEILAAARGGLAAVHALMGDILDYLTT